MDKILITGANGFIGKYLGSYYKDATKIGHNDCDLSDWNQVKNIKWEGEIIINCAHVGKYGQDVQGSVEKNILLTLNLKRRWPGAKLISFGSGAMYDKNSPIVKAKVTDDIKYPTDLYGLAKRLTVDMSDVTLIVFGIFAKIRYIEYVLKQLENKKPVIIRQDVKFSWVNLCEIPIIIDWAIKHGKGRYNLCDYDMLLSRMAKYLGAKKISFEKEGKGLEYTGEANLDIKLKECPSF